jgi:glycosyltransferase involved in cell wall biosynthesis
MKKIRIAFICHFSNQEIRWQLPLNNLRIRNLIKKVLGKKIWNYSDFAPWVTTIISEFEKIENVELHVISPHFGLKSKICTFTYNNIWYYFFKPENSSYLKRLLPISNKNDDPQFKENRRVVGQVLKQIQPDVINLFGAENPYYSIIALDIKRTPVNVLLQAVLNTPFKDVHNYRVDKNRLEIERKIFESCGYFGTASRMYNDCVLKVNPTAEIFEFLFPTQRPPEILSQEVFYDFVFFAKSVNNIKGIEDTIEALSLVKKNRSSVKLNIVGSCDPDYKVFLFNRIVDLGLKDNIEFHDYFPEHKDMFLQVKKSKIAVLPNKLDVLSSTIREAMFLEIPIATTITTGTPYLNAKNQTVLLSEIGNIEKLASNMYRLLIDYELCNDLVRNAKALAEEVFDNSAIAKKLVKDNIAIVEHFNENKPIPKELLFNPDNYPEY